MQLFHLHRAEPAHPAKVVAAKVHQHVVFSQLLFVGQKFDFQCLVLLVGLSAGAGTCQRKGVQHAVFQLDQRFRRGPGHLHIGAGEIEHIRRWVDGAQHPVGPQQTAFKGGRQPVGKHDLKDLALADGVLCLLHHPAVSRLVKKRLWFVQQSSGGFLLLGSGLQKLCQTVQPEDGFVIVRFQRVRLQRHIHDEHDLLPQVIKGNHLIEQHQVHILEILRVLRLCAGLWLTVAEVIVGKVAYKAAGEGGQVCKARAFVLGQNLPQHLRGVLCFKSEFPGLHHAIPAGDLHFGIQTQNGVAAPLFAGLGALQQVAVGGDVL